MSQYCLTICPIFFQSYDREKELWEVMSKKNVNCTKHKSEIWLGITDNQKEGEFRSINGSFYEDVFEYGATVGNTLKATRWAESQPNGGVSENCVVTSKRANGWNDRQCKASRCVACSIRANRLFHLRGLCRLTR